MRKRRKRKIAKVETHYFRSPHFHPLSHFLYFPLFFFPFSSVPLIFSLPTLLISFSVFSFFLSSLGTHIGSNRQKFWPHPPPPLFLSSFLASFSLPFSLLFLSPSSSSFYFLTRKFFLLNSLTSFVRERVSEN